MNLEAFLVPMLEETKEVNVSKRFIDKEGNQVPFKIKSLTAEEAMVIQRRYTKTAKTGIQSLDFMEFQTATVVESVVEPDLKNSELQKHYGVLGEKNLLLKMLTIAEFTKLRTAVFEMSDLDIDINETIEEAKN
ncbi:MAG: phage tail assembly chaperone [Anaerorhabdus sp.]|uniref:phage tail assembly chaperone n=1 Tax=Anaerorhabdus sp. TaxID=1872524 RepID=UPI003A848590